MTPEREAEIRSHNRTAVFPGDVPELLAEIEVLRQERYHFQGSFKAACDDAQRLAEKCDALAARVRELETALRGLLDLAYDWAPAHNEWEPSEGKTLDIAQAALAPTQRDTP